MASLKKAIRVFCLECNGTSQAFNVTNDCVSPSCALYPHRPTYRGAPGQNRRKVSVNCTEETARKRTDALAKARAARKR